MDDLTPRERAALDRALAAKRDCETAFQNFQLASMGAAKRIDEFAATFMEYEQREFIGIVAGY